MISLVPGQNLLLNNRRWTLWQVDSESEPALILEAISVSPASLGMTRRLKAFQYEANLFIEQAQRGYWQANLSRDWTESEFGPALQCRPATPLDLLAAHTRSLSLQEERRRFSWSYSRAARYRFCPRAYYYHYYAAWGGWSKQAAPPVRRAYLLKNLIDIPRWIGILVHDTLKFALARLKSGRPLSAAELISRMNSRAQADIETSVSGRYRQNPARLTGFQEHYYHTRCRPADWQAAQQRAARCVRTFIDSALYADLQQQPASTFLDIETLQSFELAGVTVWLQIDLARFDGARIYLYDWKTGSIEPAEIAEQLGVYGLYIRRARPEWSAVPIRGQVYALPEDRLIELELDGESLQEAEEKTRGSIAHLRDLLLDPEANRAELKRFPMIQDLATCQSCQFRELCGRDK